MGSRASDAYWLRCALCDAIFGCTCWVQTVHLIIFCPIVTIKTFYEPPNSWSLSYIINTNRFYYYHYMIKIMHRSHWPVWSHVHIGSNLINYLQLCTITIVVITFSWTPATQAKIKIMESGDLPLKSGRYLEICVSESGRFLNLLSWRWESSSIKREIWNLCGLQLFQHFK